MDQRGDDGGVLSGVKESGRKVCVGLRIGALEAVVGKGGIADTETGEGKTLLGT